MTEARHKSPRAQTPRGRSLAESAYAALKQRIVSCQMMPGALTTEGELVRSLKIGKTPVREALARLVQDGLVRNIPRHGYEITPITLRDVRDLFGLRLIVEPASVQLAAGHVDTADLRRLDDLCRAHYRPGDPDTVHQFLSANSEFHVTIARASGNPRLAELVERVLVQSERVYHLGLLWLNRADAMAHEHHELMDALAVGDGDRARKIAISQILEAQRMMTEALLSSPGVLAAEVGGQGRASGTDARITPASRRRRGRRTQ